MNVMEQISKPALSRDRPICIAVLAIGGQGGGVLVDWIVALAESQGWAAQSTSVPGVAQRTGATVYYVEMLPVPPGGAAKRRPVFALMPGAGVDIVIAAELMEAGRAIQRGFVTPDVTTLIASSHRVYAVLEKAAPGNGIEDGGKVYEAAASAAKRFVAFDMQQLANQSGSVISAVLFGALAGSRILSFPLEAYEATIRTSGVGVASSLKGLALGYEAAQAEITSSTHSLAPPLGAAKEYPPLAPIGHPGFDALVQRAAIALPASVHDMVAAGLRRVVDFQDVDYGREYLDIIESICALDRASDGARQAFRLTRAAAKHVATAMAYEDVIRVADLKTRAQRFERVRNEVGATTDQLLGITEFMHPRMDEVVDMLPARLGAFVENRPRLFGALDRIVNRGRRVQTSKLRWFLILYTLAGLSRFRRVMLRHAREKRHREAWLARAMAAAGKDYALAVELVELRRLVKGYSDTRSRGESKFDQVMAAATRLEGRADAADWVRRLHRAALLDEDGVAMREAIATVDSFL